MVLLAVCSLVTRHFLKCHDSRRLLLLGSPSLPLLRLQDLVPSVSCGSAWRRTAASWLSFDDVGGAPLRVRPTNVDPDDDYFDYSGMDGEDGGL